MSKHTAGPWVFSVDGGDRQIAAANGEILMSDPSYYPWCPEIDADWVLIAAAPDLYAEAVKVLDQLDNEGLSRRFQGLREAVAKAEGKKP